MATTGKLFGTIGNTASTASAACPVTERPGYSAWYSQLMARSYAARQDAAATVLFLAMPLRHARALAA